MEPGGGSFAGNNVLGNLLHQGQHLVDGFQTQHDFVPLGFFGGV